MTTARSTCCSTLTSPVKRRLITSSSGASTSRWKRWELAVCEWHIRNEAAGFKRWITVEARLNCYSLSRQMPVNDIICHSAAFCTLPLLVACQEWPLSYAKYCYTSSQRGYWAPIAHPDTHIILLTIFQVRQLTPSPLVSYSSCEKETLGIIDTVHLFTDEMHCVSVSEPGKAWIGC